MPSRLEDLDLLVALVEHGSFTSAARHRGTTQSRVSRAIARLEDGLGQVLVRRSPRQVSPTRAGRQLAEHARQMLRDLIAVEAALGAGDGMTGPLVLSTPPALGRRLLAPAIGSFCLAHPGIRLDWTLGPRRVDLIAEEVDVGLRFGPLAPTWERARSVLRGAFHLYAAPGVADRASLPQDLSTLRTLGFHATHLRDRWPLVVDGEVTWFEVEPAHWTDDADALIGLAVAGLGVMLMADFLVTHEVATGQLVRLTEQNMAVPAEVYANLGAQQPTARARALVDHVASALSREAEPTSGRSI